MAWRFGLGASFHSLSIIQPACTLFFSSSLIISCHWLLDLLSCRILPLFFFFYSSTFSLLPSPPSPVMYTVWHQGKYRKYKKRKTTKKTPTSREIEAERAWGDGTQRNLRSLPEKHWPLRDTTISFNVHALIYPLPNARVYMYHRAHTKVIQACVLCLRSFSQPLTLSVIARAAVINYSVPECACECKEGLSWWITCIPFDTMYTI